MPADPRAAPRPFVRAAAAAARFPALDAVRGLAALAVVGFHSYKDVAGRPADGGPLGSLFMALDWGVPVFFVLSGFLLYRPFAAAIASGSPRPGARDFLVRRAARILPAYWLVLVVYGSLVAPGDLWTPIGLLRYGLLQQAYDQATVYHILATAWTLSVEASFYLVLPVLAALAARSLGPRPTLGRHLALLAALAAGFAGLSALVVVPVLGSFGQKAEQAGFTLAGSFEPFAAGMAVAIVHVHRAELRQLPRRLRSAWLATVRSDRAWLAGAGLVAAAGLVLEGGHVMPFSSTHAATLAAAVLFVPLVFRPRASRLARWLAETRALAFTGTISYGIYLWHWPIQEIARTHGFAVPHTIAGWAVSATAIGSASLLPAWLSYRLVERPLTGWAHRRSASPAGAAGLVSAAGRGADPARAAGPPGASVTFGASREPPALNGGRPPWWGTSGGDRAPTRAGAPALPGPPAARSGAARPGRAGIRLRPRTSLQTRPS